MSQVDLRIGDCLDILTTLPGGGVDVVVVDPPYGIGESSAKNSTRSKVVSAKNSTRSKVLSAKNYGDYSWDKDRLDKRVFDEMFRVSKNQVVFGGNYYTDYLPPSSSWIVWNKLNSGDFADCELAWTSHKRAVRRIDYLWNGMFKKYPEERFHPTQKPLFVMTWVIEHYTNPGDTVLDFCMGSGTTGVACAHLGRNFIGIERDQRYFDVASKRIAEAQAQLPLFDQGLVEAENKSQQLTFVG